MPSALAEALLGSLTYKRRRLSRPPRSAFGMASKQAMWPAGADALPVEIFALITSYLPRPSIQAMRLVCRDFEHKVSAEYFKNVVVTFRPELYSSSEGGSQVNVDESTTTTKGHVLDDGMRVFKSFGAHMRGFALVLELSEGELAYPPIKCTQKTVTSFWGIYRWPEQEYQRYGQLEFAEDLADETGRLATAFTHLTHLQELALSCDAGLGYLRGPDVNQHFPLRLHKVLQRSRYAPELAPTIQDAYRKNALPAEEGRTPMYMLLKKMLLEEGYQENQLTEAVEILMSNEFSASQLFNHKHELKSAQPARGDVEEIAAPIVAEMIRQKQAKEQTRDPHLLATGLTASDCSEAPKLFVPARLTTAQLELLLELEWAQRALIQSYVITVTDIGTAGRFNNLTTLTIARIAANHAAHLTRKDFWRALSNVGKVSIGVIPDWRKLEKTGRYTNVTDEKLPPPRSCAAVFELLQVCGVETPKMKSLHFEWVGGGEFAGGLSQRDRYVMPAPFYASPAAMLEARPSIQLTDTLWLPRVVNLSLKNCWFTPHAFIQIVRDLSERETLQSLTLESVSLTAPPDSTSSQPNVKIASAGAHWPWPLCAGVLPGRPFNLVRPQAGGQIAVLQAPASPDQDALPVIANGGALGAFAHHHIPPVVAVNDQMAAQMAAAAQQHTQQLAAMANLLGGQPANPQPQGNALVPDQFSWAHVLNELTPGPTILQSVEGLEDDNNVVEGFDELRGKLYQYVSPMRRLGSKAQKLGKLQYITFRSCGYVLVDVPQLRNWEQLILRAPRLSSIAPQSEETFRRLKELDEGMQISTDPLLGTIFNHMNVRDEHILQTIFGMRLGWNGVYDADVLTAAGLDGNPIAGAGRFSGECLRGRMAASVFPANGAGSDDGDDEAED